MKKLFLLSSIIFMANIKTEDTISIKKDKSNVFEISLHVIIPSSIFVAGVNTVRSLPEILKALPKKSLVIPVASMILAQQVFGKERNEYVSFDDSEILKNFIQSNGLGNLTRDIMEIPENTSELVNMLGEYSNFEAMLDNFNENAQERTEESEIVTNYL